MAGQTELRPVKGACRYLRARYKVEQRRKSPFPELTLIRYECAHSFDVDSDESIEKCMEVRLDCWQEAAKS